jgi:hypothetical protein
MTDRPVKNPERVSPALWSSGPGPVGLNPGGRNVIDTSKESPGMAKIEKTGVYENADGDRVFYRENHPVHEDVLADLKLVGEGVPVSDTEKARLEREQARMQRLRDEQGTDTADYGSKSKRSKGAAPENRMEPAPENRSA